MNQTMTRDEERIAQRTGASNCRIVPGSDKPPHKGQYLMAVFGTDVETRQHYAFYLKFPLANGWQDQIIRRLLSMKREKA